MIRRDAYIKQVTPFIDKNIVKVMTGMRRSGKSVLLELIQQELLRQGKKKNSFLSVNFESRLLPFSKDIDSTFTYLREFIEGDPSKKYCFFDEIQELPHWEELINSLMIDFEVDIYITGSNAKMLSSELATYLAGRYVEIKVYPFSFQEIIEISEEKTPAKELFLHYLQYGGMPFLYANDLSKEGALQYLEDVFNSIVLKDIANRNNIRDIELFQRTLNFFISSIGHTYSAKSIRDFLKNEYRSLSTETLYNYIEYCKEAIIIHMLKREDLVGKKLLSFQEKLYLTDHGIREAIYGNNLRDIGQILENIVYIELLRRGYAVAVGKLDSREIDFVAKRASERIYVQVAYLLTDENTLHREFSVLKEVADNFPKYVVTMDEIDRSHDGIKHLNIIDFLLIDKL